MRVWGLENPHATVEEQKSKEKVMVWCAMTSTSILGPFFFEDTVTGESYLDMLKRFYFPHDKRQGNLDQVVFQQDGASVYVAGQVKVFLQDTFGTQIISRGFDYE